MKIHVRATLFTLLLVTLISGALLAVIYQETSQTFYRHIQQEQESRMRVAVDLLQALGKPLHLAGGQLMAGSHNLVGDEALVDHVSSLAGGNASLFQGDERIATNIRLPDGSRAVGTRFIGKTQQAVFDRGENYRGATMVLGEPFLTAYNLLRNSDGAVIGMLEVGAPRTPYAGILKTMLVQSIGWTLLGVLAIGFLVFWALRQLTLELEEISERNKLLLQSTSSGIFQVDISGRCTFINQAGAAFLGGDPEKLRGMEIHPLIHSGSGVSAQECPLCQAFQHGTNYSNEDDRFYGLAKANFPVEVQSSPLVRKNQVVGAVVVFMDISDRKKREKEIFHKNREIEETRLMLAESTELKAAFFSTISSEIRLPMNGVIGMASVLMNSQLDPEQGLLAENIRRSGESLIHLVDLMEDFAKLDAKRLVLEDGPFDLAEVLEFVFAELESAANEKKVDLTYDLDELAPTGFLGDELRLQQILYTLIGEAMETCQEREVKVAVTSTLIGSNRYQIDFAISNSNSHQPIREMAGIQPITPTQILSKHKLEANALGLVVCKGLSELMGGGMEYSQGLGKERMLYFSILALRSTTRIRRVSRGAAPRLPQAVLLLGIQDKISRLIVRRYSEHWGMQVIAVETPAELMESLKQSKHYDLAVVQRQFLSEESLQVIQGYSVPLVELTLDRQSISPISLRGTPFNARIQSPIIMKMVRQAFISAMMSKKYLARQVSS